MHWKVANSDVELWLEDAEEVRTKIRTQEYLPTVTVKHNGVLIQTIADQAARQVQGIRIVRTQRQLQICTRAKVERRSDAVAIIEAIVSELEEIFRIGRRRAAPGRTPGWHNVPPKVRGRR